MAIQGIPEVQKFEFVQITKDGGAQINYGGDNLWFGRNAGETLGAFANKVRRGLVKTFPKGLRGCGFRVSIDSETEDLIVRAGPAFIGQHIDEDEDEIIEGQRTWSAIADGVRVAADDSAFSLKYSDPKLHQAASFAFAATRILMNIANTAVKTPSGVGIVEKCLDIAGMLVDKNRMYGDSALNPIRVFSDLDEDAGILVRLDDKLSRLRMGSSDDNEDVILDIVGYLVLLLLKRDK